MLFPFECAACGRGLYVLSGRLGKLCQAVALLIDMGEVLRASAVGLERRKRLLDICIDLSSPKDLVVLAMMDDELMEVVVGVSQKVANFVGELTGAAVITAGLMVQCTPCLVTGAFRGVSARERDA